jgi:hypothetical protein
MSDPLDPYTNDIEQADSSEEEQLGLFEDFYELHWQQMPEFVQDGKKGFAEVLVRVRNEEDLKKLAELLDQTITQQTKSIWYPALEKGLNAHKRWVDEDES